MQIPRFFLYYFQLHANNSQTLLKVWRDSGMWVFCFVSSITPVLYRAGRWHWEQGQGFKIRINWYYFGICHLLVVGLKQTIMVFMPVL